MTSYCELLAPDLPDLHYEVIAVNDCDRKVLRNMGNTIGAIFLLDQSYDFSELPDRLADAAPGIRNMDPATFATFKVWFTLIICTGFPEECVEDLLKQLRELILEEVSKMTYNLAETIDKHLKKVLDEGVSKRNIEIVRNMMIHNVPIETICLFTGLSADEVQNMS